MSSRTGKSVCHHIAGGLSVGGEGIQCDSDHRANTSRLGIAWLTDTCPATEVDPIQCLSALDVGEMA